jgi:hypothetical protein
MALHLTPTMIVYGMTHVFQTLDLAPNEPIQQGLPPLLLSDRPMLKCDELCWLKLAMNGVATNQMNSKFQYNFKTLKPETKDEHC